MNRPIKFRAWDTSGNFMLENNEIGSLIFFEDGAVHVESKGDEFPCVVLMQHTGSSDKDGKEIYEGDFLRFENLKYDPSEGDTPWLYRPVRFDEFMWKLGDDPLSDWPKEDIEVIGNVYENPDFPTDL